MYNYADQLCARTRRRRKGCCRCSTSARENGWDVTVAVVDAGGYPILLARMDNASPASVATVVGKAQTAALIGMPTKLVEAMVSDRPALLSMDRVAVEGGVPILFRGQNSAALVFPACNPLTMPRSHKPRRPPSKARSDERRVGQESVSTCKTR